MSLSFGAIWKTAGMMSAVRTDWATPQTLYRMLDREFHFQLDACASAATATCEQWFGADALSLDWAPVTWCNPPYGRAVGGWVEKAHREAQRGNTVVMLLPARTDTQWFHDYCVRHEIRFLRGRLNFDDKPNRLGHCPFPSMVVVFRPGRAGRAPSCDAAANPENMAGLAEPLC